MRTRLVLAALLTLVACGDKEDSGAACSAGCEGTVLTECDGGEPVETDCADDGMICHDMGDDSHCMMEDMDM